MSEMNTKTNTGNTPVADDEVYLTPPAVTEVKRLLAEQENNSDLMLRVSVQGGGCSGLSYDMKFDGIHGEFDTVFEFDGLKVVVDAKSLIYIGGTTIDFTKELLTGGFKFENPKSARSCGCGTSFSV
jgi:iron-sulfur cluster assembly protein